MQLTHEGLLEEAAAMALEIRFMGRTIDALASDNAQLRQRLAELEEPAEAKEEGEPG